MDFFDTSVDGQPVVPVSPPDPIVDYGACAVCNVPEFLQPGLKTLVFKPAETAVFGRVHRNLAPLETDCLDALPYPTTGLETGYYNHDGRGLAFGCQLNIIWQAGFNFDLSMLRQARAGGHWFPTDAVLTFKETPYPAATDDPAHAGHLQNPDGVELPTPTCWLRLATPTVDWSGETATRSRTTSFAIRMWSAALAFTPRPWEWWSTRRSSVWGFCC